MARTCLESGMVSMMPAGGRISLLAASPVISLPVCKVSSKFLQHNRCKVICLQRRREAPIRIGQGPGTRVT